MGEVELRRVGAGASLADAFAVRRAVFVEGQGVDEALEIDGKDDAARHVVAYRDGEAIGTARLRSPEPGVAKIERVAVREDHREEGIGRRLMDAIERLARDAGHKEAVLHAQTPVAAFYESLGYEFVSDVFQEAGIPHVEMRKELKAAPENDEDAE